MKSVRQLLEAKGRQVWSVSPSDSVFEAIRRMAEHEIGAVVVLDGAHFLGILTERDYARKVILHGRHSKDVRVAEVMSSPTPTATLDDTVEDCMEKMTRQRVRHLPILDNERLVGIVSIGDLVKSIIDEQKDRIETLEQYIYS